MGCKINRKVTMEAIKNIKTLIAEAIITLETDVRGTVNEPISIEMVAGINHEAILIKEETESFINDQMRLLGVRAAESHEKKEPLKRFFNEQNYDLPKNRNPLA